MNTPTSPNTSPAARATNADTAKSAGEDLRRDAEAKAREVGQSIADEARHRADTAKEGVAEEISSVGQALRRASDELRQGSPQERTFGSMASAMADLADTVRGKDLGEMVGDLSDFARRNPVAFLGGAALLGFAGARMAKASQRARHDLDQPDSLGEGPRHHTSTAPHATPVRPGSAPTPTSAPSPATQGGA